MSEKEERLHEIGKIIIEGEPEGQWIEDWAEQGTEEIERFLGKHALFLDEIGEVQEYPV